MPLICKIRNEDYGMFTTSGTLPFFTLSLPWKLVKQILLLLCFIDGKLRLKGTK